VLIEGRSCARASTIRVYACHDIGAVREYACGVCQRKSVWVIVYVCVCV